MGGYTMDNYVRYLIRFIVILFLVGVAFLFVIAVKNSAASKLNNKTDLTNVIHHDETDTIKEESKAGDTKQEEVKKNNNTTSESITKYNETNKVTSTKSITTNTTKPVTSNETNNGSNINNQKETIRTEEIKNDNVESKVDDDKEVEFSLNFDKKSLNIGETAKIVVSSDTKNLKIKYKSFDKSVATITSNGTIKALNKGSTYLEVNVNDDSSKIIELVVTDSKKDDINNNQNNNSSSSKDDNKVSDTNNKNDSTNITTKPNDNNNSTTNGNDTVIDNNKTDTKKDDTTTSNEKNGWYTINNKKYFYKDNKKVTDSYIDYIYLDKRLLFKGEQKKSNDGLYRFDSIYKIKDNQTKDLWNTITRYFNSKYIVFEFKNYKSQITQKDVYTTEKYLYLKALRGVAIIISCKGTDGHAIKAIKGILRENGKLILSISNNDLIAMLNKKIKGESPTDYLEDILDDLLIELEK